MKHKFDRELLGQKLIGLALILISIVILVVAMGGKIAPHKDATAVFLLAPAGISLLFTKKRIISM